MLFFAWIAFERWNASHRIFFLLLLFRDVVFASNMLARERATDSAHWSARVLAYASTAIPLLYQAEGGAFPAPVLLAADLLAVIGFALATLATIELGRSIGVSPARRGPPCTGGVYRYLKHPMYVGYAIAECGWIILSRANIVLYAASLIGYFLRARVESRSSGQRLQPVPSSGASFLL